MVGFNRVDEKVGIVIGVMIIGGLAALSNGAIIAWDTTYTTATGLLILWTISYLRKD